MRPNKKGGPKRSRVGIELRPPPIEANPPIHLTLRFACASALSNANLTYANLFLACGAVAATATTGNGIVKAVRVNRVRIWGAAPAAGTSEIIAFRWSSSSLGYTRGNEIADVSNNPSRPPYLETRPSKDSLVADYVSVGVAATTWAVTTLPAESIIELSLSCILCDGDTTNATFSGSSGLIAGVTYYGRLDGVGGVTVPIGKAYMT